MSQSDRDVGPRLVSAPRGEAHSVMLLRNHHGSPSQEGYSQGPPTCRLRLHRVLKRLQASMCVTPPSQGAAGGDTRKGSRALGC